MSVSQAALAACGTPDPITGSLVCTGTVGSALTVYDAAAQYQPTAGSNSYTPSSYSQSPPTTVITIASGAAFSFLNPTTAQLADKGIIAANFSNAEDPAVNNVEVDNSGTVSLSTNQFVTSRMHDVVGDSQVNTFTVNNNAGGIFSVTQTATPGALSVTSSGSPATYTAKQGGAALNIMSVFYSDDNTNSFVVNNSGQINATGSFTAAYYGRADTTITNSNAITNTSWSATDTIASGHWSLVAYAGTDYVTVPGTNPDSNVVSLTGGKVTVDDTSALTVTNNAGATIKGDILALDITPLVYAAAAASNASPATNPFANYDGTLASGTSVLNLPISSSNAGPRDSSIQNNGTILGNLYLGSGTHVIDNAAGANWQGSMFVDQRAFNAVFSTPVAGTAAGSYKSAGGTDFLGNACPTAGQDTTNAGCAATSSVVAQVVGGQAFTLTNEGTLTGDIRILDQSTSVNSIALTGTGFTGNVIALNGVGNNSLTLDGVTTLASVQNFQSIDLKQSNVTVSGGVSLTPNATVSTATLATTIYGAGGTTAAPSTNLGTINGTLTLNGATSIAPTLATGVHNGDVFQVASLVTGAGTSSLSANSPNALVTFTTDTSTGKLLLDTSVANASTISGLSAAGAATLNSLIGSSSSNPNFGALQGAVENLSTNDLRKAGEQLRPDVNGGSVQAPLEISRLVFNEINNHLLGSIGAPATSASYTQPAFAAPSGLGMSQGLRSNLGAGGGDDPTFEPRVKGAWVQGFGARVDQTTTSNVDGYSADIGGLMGGFDTRVSPGLRLGGGFAVASTTVNDAGVTATNHQDITSYFGMVYSSWTNGTGYLNGLVGFGANDYTGTRQLTAGGLSDSAAQSHSGTQFMAAVEAGVPKRLGFATIVPTASFRYVNLNQDGYSETSTGGMALKVGSQQNDSAVSGLGLRAQIPLFAAAFASSIEGRAMWLHEFGDVVQQATASFVGGSPSFVAAGPNASRDLIDVGLGLKIASSDPSGAAIVVGYDGAFGDGYTAHAGSLRARLGF